MPQTIAETAIEDLLLPIELQALDAELIAILRDADSHEDKWPIPVLPPIDYFGPIPNLKAGTKISVTASGELFGYFAEWGQCVTGAPISNTPGRDCFQPIPSPTGYERFHQGTTITASGSIATGMIGADGHAPPNMNVVQSMAHYQNAKEGKMEGRVYENDIGIYFHGSLTPQATIADVKMIVASALSGDWRYITNMRLPTGNYADGWDCLGPCMVLRPGLALQRETREGKNLAVTASANVGVVGDDLPEPRFYSYFVSTEEPAMNKTKTTVTASGGTAPEPSTDPDAASPVQAMAGDNPGGGGGSGDATGIDVDTEGDEEELETIRQIQSENSARIDQLEEMVVALVDQNQQLEELSAEPMEEM